MVTLYMAVIAHKATAEVCTTWFVVVYYGVVMYHGMVEAVG